MHTIPSISRARLRSGRVMFYAAPALAAALLSGQAFAQNPPPVTAPPVHAQAEPCKTCGHVESVVAVQREGETRGIAGSRVTPGMAVGGVVGGLLGNQIGSGGGRTATTVLGAAGGAYA